MNVTGLFAGVGGFERGLTRSGFETNLLCEADPAASAVLQTRFPHVPLVSDVRRLDTLPENTDVLCAGFPCQDLSSVGRKAGIRGTQSSLVGEVFRLLERRPVEWVVVENVRFMLHLRKGAAMQTIAEGFERLGYSWAYRVVDAQAFGLPQRRHRVFFVAARHHDPRRVLFADDAGPPQKRKPADNTPLGFYWTEGTYAVGLAVNAVPPLKGGSTVGIPSPPAIAFAHGFAATPDVRDAERLQGFDPDWTAPAADVARKSLRWKLVGNAVCVPVAEWLGRRLREPGDYDDSADVPLTGKWPEAAWSIGGERHTASVSNWPVRNRRRGVGRFLRYEPRPLSARATSGFLSRARKGGLRFPDGFLARLEAHLGTQPQ